MTKIKTQEEQDWQDAMGTWYGERVVPRSQNGELFMRTEYLIEDFKDFCHSADYTIKFGPHRFALFLQEQGHYRMGNTSLRPIQLKK